MKCDECGSETKVIETHKTDEAVHRLRQCPACKWMCNSLEQYIDEAYRPSVMNKKRKRNDSQTHHSHA